MRVSKNPIIHLFMTKKCHSLLPKIYNLYKNDLRVKKEYGCKAIHIDKINNNI